jgi:hypothetical protein
MRFRRNFIALQSFKNGEDAEEFQIHFLERKDMNGIIRIEECAIRMWRADHRFQESTGGSSRDNSEPDPQEIAGISMTPFLYVFQTHRPSRNPPKHQKMSTPPHHQLFQ